ncbi:MAG: site-specific DNA-methyltransferase [Candidatus Peribacter sp.]|nr:site-specific DNA-methyltransferase [Candidatus Peribacter sp.]
MSSSSKSAAKPAIKPSSRLDHLLTKITDPTLRTELEREASKLRMHKKFGLVFEEHLPEHVRLPHLPVVLGAKVVMRDGDGSDVFNVVKVTGSKAHILHEIEGKWSEVAMKELVVIKKFGEPIYPSLVPVDHVTHSKEKPYHTIINAENYHALQLLLYCYEGQVDVIYIDPPYNTGARDWKYNNNYVDLNDQYRHSKWLSMMKRRLTLARKLLKPDGILIVTIDENELPTLNLLLWEIFPRYDITPVIIRHNPRGIQGDNFSYCNEVAFFVTPNGQKVINGRKLSAEQQESTPLRKWGNDSKRSSAKNCFYPIYFDDGNFFKAGTVPSDDFHPKSSFRKLKSGLMEFWPIDNKGVERKWRYATQSIDEIAHFLSIEERDSIPQVIITKDNAQYKTVWIDSAFDASTHGKRLLGKIVETDFSFPKSLYATGECLRAAGKNDALILDFFAGSGTTLHATLLLNAEDSGTRRCILVTNNEVEDKKSKILAKKNIHPGDSRFEKYGICEEVTWPRCKYVVDGKRDDGTELSGEYLNGRELSKGFEENIQYLRLDYLDPNDIAYREKLSDILPILWLASGTKGSYEDLERDGKWFIPKHSSYAVLMKESHFTKFNAEIRERPDITHVFLVTDSEEAYREMAGQLPKKCTLKMLYKSYLENFRINIPREP